MLIGALTGLAWVLGALVPYVVGQERCDDSTGDISCEGAAVMSLIFLTACGAAAGAVFGVLTWLIHYAFLVKPLPHFEDEG